MAFTTGIGSAILASLVQSVFQMIQTTYNKIRGNQVSFSDDLGNSKRISLSSSPSEEQQQHGGLFQMLIKHTKDLISNLNKFTLIFIALQNDSYLYGAIKCTRMFHRNLILGLTTSAVSRIILLFGGLVSSSTIALIVLHLSGDQEFSSIMKAGSIGILIWGFVPFACLQFITNIVQTT